MCLAENEFSVCAWCNFELQCANVYVAAQRPEVRLLDAVNTVELFHFVKTSRQHIVEFLRLTLHQDGQRITNQRHDTVHRTKRKALGLYVKFRSCHFRQAYCRLTLIKPETWTCSSSDSLHIRYFLQKKACIQHQKDHRIWAYSDIWFNCIWTKVEHDCSCTAAKQYTGHLNASQMLQKCIACLKSLLRNKKVKIKITSFRSNSRMILERSVMFGSFYLHGLL